MAQARVNMKPDTWRLFYRNVQCIIAPGRGRKSGSYGESMLRMWLAVSYLNRERLDPRPRPPMRERLV